MIFSLATALIYLYSLRIAVIFRRLIRAVSFNRLCVTLTQFIMGNHKVIKLIRSSERRFCTFFKIFFGYEQLFNALQIGLRQCKYKLSADFDHMAAKSHAQSRKMHVDTVGYNIQNSEQSKIGKGAFKRNRAGNRVYTAALPRSEHFG